MRFRFGYLLWAVIPFFSSTAFAVENFRIAKKHLPEIFQPRPLTLYCRCPFRGKRVDIRACGYEVYKSRGRAQRIEWEHVVPAHAFGQAFREWRDGAPQCRKKGKSFRGRKCAETVPDFNRMEGDLYNLFPEVGELNGLRSNYSMAEMGMPEELSGVTFGKCKAVIHQQKFEPMDFAKGTVARTYFYMDGMYPGKGIISDKNRKLFEAWDKLYPVESWECDWYRRVKEVQKTENVILQARCQSS